MEKKKEKKLKETDIDKEQKTTTEAKTDTEPKVDNEKKENAQKKIKLKQILLISFVLLNIVIIIVLVTLINNNTLEGQITSAVKDYLRENTSNIYDIADITSITITNTKMEQLEDKKQFSVYGTFMIKDNYKKMFQASFKGTYDVVNKDGKEIYYSNQIKSNTIISYPTGILYKTRTN